MSSSPRPRVLHVAQPVTAGVAVAVAGYVKMLAAEGWDTVVACPPGGELAHAAESAGAQWVRWDASRAPGPSAMREARALARVVEQVRPDVVHLHSSKAGLAGRLVRGHGVPVVFTPHAWSWLGATGPVSVAALGWERLAAGRASAVMCGAADEARAGRAAGLGAARWEVLTNVVDVDDLPPVGRDAARGELGLAPTRALVVCPARVSHQKGQDTLFEAWRRAAPEAQLVLVGSMAGDEGILATAPPGTMVVTPRSRTEALLWCAAADLVVAPSRYETLSLAVLEAAAMGAPVLASDVGGMREALVGTPASILPPEDAGALAAALTDALARCSELAAAAERSAPLVRRRLRSTWLAGAGQLDRLYRDLITAHVSPVPSISALSRAATTAVSATSPSRLRTPARPVPRHHDRALSPDVHHPAPVSSGAAPSGGSR